MKTLVTSNINQDQDLIISDTGVQDIMTVDVILGGEHIQLNVLELYRSILPFVTKLSPEQAQTTKL